MLITKQEDLRRLYDQPNDRVVRKCLPRLDQHCRKFISLSPFLVVSTSANGKADASPRGDKRGFVEVLGDNTILIPDRPGNNRLDTMQNLLENPAIGLIFFIPGINETLRVNGKAVISAAPELLEGFAIDGRLPKAAIVVSVEEAYLHCAKALMRSHLWNPSMQIDRSALPSAGQIQAEQIGLDAATIEREIEHHNRTMLY